MTGFDTPRGGTHPVRTDRNRNEKTSFLVALNAQDACTGSVFPVCAGPVMSRPGNPVGMQGTMFPLYPQCRFRHLTGFAAVAV